jgi:hypothetical protein
VFLLLAIPYVIRIENRQHQVKTYKEYGEKYDTQNE